MTPATWEQAAAAAAHQLSMHARLTDKVRDPQWLDGYLGGIIRAAKAPAGYVFADDFAYLGAMALPELERAKELDRILRLITSKQHDYGHDNINRFGVDGILVRLSDKCARLLNLMGRPNPSNEAVADTYDDIVGYCVIAIMLLAGTFDLPLQRDLTDYESVELF